MVVGLAEDQLGGFSGSANGGEEILRLALEFRRLAAAVGENERGVPAVEMALRDEFFDHGVGELDVSTALRQPHRRKIVHAAEQQRALTEIVRQIFLAPAARQHAGGKMRSRSEEHTSE